MIRVGVVRGGISSEYDVSLKTGGNVLSHLRSDVMKDKYQTADILIDKEGLWHMNGIPTDLEHIFHKVDVIFNALHGDYGEDGKIQQIFEQWGIPYTGSSPFASALGYNKALSKDQFNILGIKTPRHLILPIYLEDIDGPREEYASSKARDIWNKLPPPWIVKPLAGGSSVGMHLCKTFPELINAINKTTESKSSILVEEFIAGKEATVGVIDEFRGKKVYTLPAVEIRIPKSSKFFDYEAKYSGATKEICPGNFTYEEKAELERLAALIHTGLNLNHYSRSDFIVNPKKGIYALEVNTLPGLTDESLTPKALSAVGVTMPEFISHIIKLALRKR